MNLNFYAILLGKKLAGGGGGGDITVESLSVTENGTTTAPAGKAYSPVVVNVPQTTVESLSVTENGTTTAPAGKAYSPVVVNVPQITVEPISITTNGTTTAPAGKAYSPITVNVSGGTGKFADLVQRSITTVTAEDLAGATTVGTYAFYDCNSLASVVLPNSVQSVGQGAFESCDYLTNVNVGDGVTTIATRAFYGCNRLATVVLGSALTSIGANVFTRKAAVEFTFFATTPPTIQPNTFLAASDLWDTFKIYVPASSLETYQTAQNWSSYASHIYAIST